VIALAIFSYVYLPTSSYARPRSGCGPEATVAIDAAIGACLFHQAAISSVTSRDELTSEVKVSFY